MTASFIVMLGPPGAGKGTQAEVLAEKLNLPHISSGDIFRENIKNQTELGKKVQKYLDSGGLVPDDLTIDMIRERLSKPDAAGKGAILDGFPRTPAQAEALSKTLAGMGGEVKLVPYISVPAQDLVERLTGRWTCRAQGHIFHEKNNPPKQAGKCDLDGSELYQRDDDKPETVANRIRVYDEQTAPLIAYYRQHGLLVELDGRQPIDQVTEELLKTVQQHVS
jgi:adenylate kinase